MITTSAAILERLFDPDQIHWSSETARHLLKLDFRPADHARMEELSAKASEGSLSPAEKEELEEYLRVGDFLAILQSKARLALKRADAAA